MRLLTISSHNESKWLSALATSDQHALTSIYKKYWQPLFISAYNVLKDKQACEDIVQELFLELWKRRATLNVHSSLEAYLHKAVVYKVFRHIRNNRHRAEWFEGFEEASYYSTPETHLQVKETLREATHAINRLPEKCREIYKLSRENELSNREIAHQLDISVKTVENQLTIATRKLRRNLGRMLCLLLFLS